VANGGFEQGGARWFTSAADHWPWHIENFWVAILFDMGWWGVLVVAFVIVYFAGQLLRRAWRGDAFAAAALAATVGFLGVGLFGSLVESPRVMTTFLLTVLLGGSLVWVREASAAVPGSFVRPVRIEGAAEARKQERFACWAAASHAVLCIAIGAASIWLITRVPFTPYNVRDLPNPFHPWAAPFLLAAFFWWVFAVPAWMARWLASDSRGWMLFPVAVIGHGVIAWAIVRFAVLPAMIHKVTGSPVLQWPWAWETLGRFVALDGALVVALTGAGLLVLACTRRTGLVRGGLTWMIWAVALMPITWWVVISNAATDNLTELIAGGGAPAACALLVLWVVSIGVGAAGLRYALARNRRSSVLGLSIVVLSVPMGFALLWAGTEPAVEKFGVIFSAMQFMLSTDRAHYAEGWELGVRYLAAHAGLLLGIAACQWPAWSTGRPSEQCLR
jgi:hypothetical protein